MLTEKPLRAEAVILFLGLQLMCMCTGALIIGLLEKAGVAAFKQPEGIGVVAVGTFSFQGMTWGLIPLFLWFQQLDWRRFFGLRDPRLARAMGWAILTVAVLVPVLWGLQNVSAMVLTRLHRHVEEQTAVHLVETTKSLWGRLYLGGFAILLAPVAEEFIFRGMLFPFIKQLGYTWIAWIGVSALFAIIHWDAGTFLPLFVFALAFTWLYQKTGNLLAPIAAHALFNAINLAVLLSGGEPPPS